MECLVVCDIVTLKIRNSFDCFEIHGFSAFLLSFQHRTCSSLFPCAALRLEPSGPGRQVPPSAWAWCQSWSAQPVCHSQTASGHGNRKLIMVLGAMTWRSLWQQLRTRTSQATLSTVVVWSSTWRLITLQSQETTIENWISTLFGKHPLGTKSWRLLASICARTKSISSLRKSMLMRQIKRYLASQRNGLLQHGHASFRSWPGVLPKASPKFTMASISVTDTLVYQQTMLPNSPLPIPRKVMWSTRWNGQRLAMTNSYRYEADLEGSYRIFLPNLIFTFASPAPFQLVL